MYEVEVKLPAAHDRVRERLEALGATAIGRVVQIDTYYDAPHRSFESTDEALRLRRERSEGDERVELTYKGPLVDSQSKTREEFETGLTDAGAAKKLLDRLGFDPAATVRKERDRYALGDLTVSLDDVADVGEYVEVERLAPEDDISAVRSEIYDVLERLGLDPSEQVRTSYLGMKLERTQ